MVRWNGSKTRFAWFGGRRKCPCQSLSDSGRAGETRCEASLELAVPARFRFVCPALRATEAGWRCHLDRENVRPFWGRAMVTALVLAGGLHLVTTTTWWAILQGQGLREVRWSDCVWPPAWKNIDSARGRHFQALAATALAAGDYPTAIKALSSAYAVDPSREDSALLLARLMEFTRQYAGSERIFSELKVRLPHRRHHIALVHHDAMLGSFRPGSLHEQAREEWRLSGYRDHAWLIPLAYTAREPGHQEDSHASADDTADFNVLLQAARATVHEPAWDQIVEDTLKLAVPEPLLARLRWELLLIAGDRAAARSALNQDRAQLSAFETALADWATLEPDVSPLLMDYAWREILPFEPNPNHYDRMVAVALLSGNPASLRLLRIRIPPQDRSSLAALWVLARLRGETRLADQVLADLGFDPQHPLFDLRPGNIRARIPEISLVLPIPRETRYALIPISARPNDS